ncbi:hypothetical protein NL108_017956 [Boleophthalmus pectinirostris]|nr:hypothetical protein NL108_017956 [Boleophthalmus pectinirostris]
MSQNNCRNVENDKDGLDLVSMGRGLGLVLVFKSLGLVSVSTLRGVGLVLVAGPCGLTLVLVWISVILTLDTNADLFFITKTLNIKLCVLVLDDSPIRTQKERHMTHLGWWFKAEIQCV